jgi:hypothetical protein
MRTACRKSCERFSVQELLGKPGIEQVEEEGSQIIPQDEQDGKDDDGDEEEYERKFDDALAAVGGEGRLSGHEYLGGLVDI